jgi:hypothetical protein
MAGFVKRPTVQPRPSEKCVPTPEEIARLHWSAKERSEDEVVVNPRVTRCQSLFGLSDPVSLKSLSCECGKGDRAATLLGLGFAGGQLSVDSCHARLRRN